MNKKIFLLLCMVLSFITFSCSKNDEPSKVKIPALTQTMWEGSEQVYENDHLTYTNSATLTFSLDNHMTYVSSSSYGQDKQIFEYTYSDKIIRIGENDYYALEASNDAMVLQTFTKSYKIILRLNRK